MQCSGNTEKAVKEVANICQKKKKSDKKNDNKV